MFTVNVFRVILLDYLVNTSNPRRQAWQSQKEHYPHPLCTTIRTRTGLYIHGRYLCLGKWGSPEVDDELRKILPELETVPQPVRKVTF